MGYHIILEASCKLLPEYIDFIKNEYIYIDQNTDDLENENPLYYHFLEIWESLGIGKYFYEYKLEGQKFSFRIEKKPYVHRQESSSYSLKDDYIRFMEEIIVPISSEIISCSIEHDDYDIPTTYYTDAELRKNKRCIAVCPNCNTKIYQ